MEVYVSTNAFWGLLISAIEVYKRECFGLLLGYRNTNDIFVVEHAISHQTAHRRHVSVEKNPRASERIDKFLQNLPQLSVIGDFHSHTAWGNLKSVDHPSEEDVREMSHENVYVILQVNDRRRVSAWRYNRNGTLSGTTDDYHFKIGAYFLDGKGRPRRAKILCPYAVGFHAAPESQKTFVRSSPNLQWSKSKA